MKAGYFHCFAGAAGDMIVGAMLDVGLPLKTLKAELAKIPVKGYRLSTSRVTRGVIAATKFNVAVSQAAGQPATLDDFLGLIDASSLSQTTKDKGKAIFQRLADAEAKVHGTSASAVHFHEIGDIDSIVDIMGAVIGVELLGLEAVFTSPLPAGSGIVKTRHGVIPVPAPAVVELLALAGAPLKGSASGFHGEVVTPTGAAILTTLASFKRPDMVLERIGYGAGSMDPPQWPNVLPLWIGEVDAAGESELVLMETNIDDTSPQVFGHVMERLLEKGARDVWFTPIQMKKNRPAVMLSILCADEAEGRLTEDIFRETSTLGLRVQRVRRVEAGREVVEFSSSLGLVKVKVKRLHGAKFSLSPEFEDCRRLAGQRGLPLQEVYRIVTEEASQKLLDITKDNLHNHR